MAIALDVIENLSGRDQEALFARDEDGQLIRKVAATREMFRKTVWVVIDGIPIEMPAAVPVTDALGNVKNGPDGLPVPRASTIYDAAVELTRKGIWQAEDLNTRIPVLCHAQHLAPIAVCRVCSVHVSKRRKRDGKLAPQDKLVPACQHEVQADMVVTTREGAYPGWDTYYRSYAKDQKKKEIGEAEKKRKREYEAKNPDGPPFAPKPEAEIDAEAKEAADAAVKAMKESLVKFSPNVRRAVNVLSELLLTDHFHPDPSRDDRFRNELDDLARTTGHLGKRPPSVSDLNLDDEDGFQMAVPESLSRQMIDLSIADASFGADPSAPRFKSKLGLPDRPADRANRNLPEQSHPKSRPIKLPVVPPPASPEDLKDDPEWVRRDEADYAKFPYSSRTILVDHDRCILCDRCVRSCSDVKPFKIIGHTGKGYTTRISFDLDKLMNDSNCVQCGECMTSCPTGALTLKRRVAPRAFADAPKIPKDPNDPLPKAGPGAASELLTALEMTKVFAKYRDEGNRVRKFRPFRTIPFSYLRWNEGSVRKRNVQPGEVLCVQGEYGRTAFFLETGEFEILFNPALAKAPEPGGFFSRLFGGKKAPAAPSDLGKVVDTATADDTILGELACLTARPRTASIRAKTAGVVYEVTRNLLDMAQRSPAARDPLGLVYVRNAVRSVLRDEKVFPGLTDDLRKKVARFLVEKDKAKDGNPVPRSELKRLEPGQVIVSEGDPASDFYVVRLGTVKIAANVRGKEWVVGKMSSNQYFGHVALLVNELAKDERVKDLLSPEELAGRRTATVTALDPVEVVKISGDAFRKLMAQVPTLRQQLYEDAVRLLEMRRKPPVPLQENRLADFLTQGLYQGQKMLVLDLDTCTRCDECTRACADSHDGTSRLLREGMRFGQFLVAASCRSCEKPYCMDGCPVDAIHRAERSLEVMIDSHCIGCSLCEKNCPFGSIQMVEQGDAKGPRKAATVQKAVNCDLCHDLVAPGEDTFCVKACPHEAAFRWDANQLMGVVAGTKDHYGRDRKAKPAATGEKPPVVNP